MLKRRLIPKLLARKPSTPSSRDFEVCISKCYSNYKRVGTLRSQLRIFESNKADELLVINTDKSPGALNTEFIEAIRESVVGLTSPIMVGGGITSLSDASSLVGVGVDKVLCGISTLNHQLHTEIASHFGSQALSISVDYSIEAEGILVGFTQKIPYTLDSFKTLIQNITDSGAGEIVLNRIDFDGSRQGLDIEMLQIALGVADVPIVVSSGAGKPEHFVAAFEAGADGIATGTFLAKLDQNPLQLRSRLFNAGIQIRI
jgi:cyclase